MYCFWYQSSPIQNIYRRVVVEQDGREIYEAFGICGDGYVDHLKTGRTDPSSFTFRNTCVYQTSAIKH